MEAIELYHQLAAAIGVGRSTIIPKIFETIINKEEAMVLLSASPATTIEEISKKTEIPIENIEKMVSVLFKKGLIFNYQKDGVTKYYRVKHIMQLFESSCISKDAPREFLDLWKEFLATEWDEHARNLEDGLPQPPIRVIPVNISIEPKTQILAFEDVQKIVEKADNIAVVNCACRAVDGKCTKPLEVCMQINRAADYAVERGTGKKLSKAQAFHLLKMCEEEGLVHITDNHQGIGQVLCNCCEDCCVNWPLHRSGRNKWVVPSRFEAEVNSESCSACESCLERCFFDAINMDGEDGKALVDSQKCMGCGLCLVTCPTDAIILKEVRPMDYVPAASD